MTQNPALNTSRLRGKMAEKRVTQSDLAAALGIDASSVSRKMTGKTDFTVTEALMIIRFLGGGTFEDYFFID